MPFVCKTSDIKPGQLKAIEVDGIIVTVANVDGTFYAFSDECTHGGCSLSQGDLWGTVINCPCHGGQFEMTTGEAIGGPVFDPITVYPVVVNGDELRIG